MDANLGISSFEMANLISMMCIFFYRVLYVVIQNRKSWELPPNLVFPYRYKTPCILCSNEKQMAKKKCCHLAALVCKDRRLSEPNERYATRRHGLLARHGPLYRHPHRFSMESFLMIEKWCFYNRINWLCFKWDILMESIRLYLANLR